MSKLGTAVALLVLCATAIAQDKLVLVSPHWEGIQREFERAFQEHYRKRTKRTVTLQWLDVGGTMAILRYIRTNFSKSPEGIGVDIFWGGGVDPYLQLKREKLLQPVRISPAVLNKLPKTIAGVPLYDPEGNWYGAAVSGFGIIFNKVVLKTLGIKQPRTWEELTNPKLFNWVAMPDPRRSGSAHMMCEIILQAYGWEKGWDVLAKIFANSKRVAPGSDEPVTDVANGEIAAAPSIDFYAWAKIAEAGEEMLGFVYPQKLTFINPDAIAMLKGAPNRKVAQIFIEFVLSEEGQKLWLLPRGTPGGPKQFTLARMSVLPHLYEQLKGQSVIKVNPFHFKPGFRYDSQKGDRRIDVLNSLLGAFFITPHGELKAYWQRAIKAGRKVTFRPPVSEAEVMKLADKWATDRKLAAQKESEWGRLAKSLYAQ
ncbi:MAG: extracellular solute-binding protein [Armatimonadetes bacterium]|nr:extracellular solute-binding protein [Armatimonadota bacterium]MCX7969372.1 extracellular solute-binding protein [Armatimonadota bacterium]MDW8144193.1 extracellular solute-binding protein [Armatimonadota bacterium]